MWSMLRRILFSLIIVSLISTYSSPAADSQIRLSGSTLCYGVVEIYHNGSWGTICDNSWDLNDTEVACRQLGCGTAQGELQNASFGQGSRQIWLDNVNCSGSERSLTDCEHRGFGTHNCSHNKAAGVNCSAILSKCNISMEPVGEVVWGQSVVFTCQISPQTQQRLNGTFILRQTSGSSRENHKPLSNLLNFSILRVNLEDEGLYQCRYKTRVSGQDVLSHWSESLKLSVSVPLQQPNISVTSLNGGLVWGAEGAEITRGYSFVFTCSISSPYPGGFFSLIFPGSNISKPAVDHSASFNFPAAEYEHQGNYSCVYEVTLSSRKFTSVAATPIGIKIKLPLLLLVSLVVSGVLLLLLVLVVIFLSLRRRRGAKQPAIIITQLAVRNSYEDCDEDDDEEDERDYVNVEPFDNNGKQADKAGGVEGEDSDSHDYEEAEFEDNYVEATEVLGYVKSNTVEVEDEEESSDDEGDYINVTESFSEQSVDIYGEHEDIYQNF